MPSRERALRCPLSQDCLSSPPHTLNPHTSLFLRRISLIHRYGYHYQVAFNLSFTGMVYGYVAFKISKALTQGMTDDGKTQTQKQERK